MLKKGDRLASGEIECLAQGKSVFGTLVSLRYIPAKRLKFAVSASKKVFKTAVERNRARRRVYGVLDMERLRSAEPAFVMFMPKKEALTAPAERLSAEVHSLLSRVL
ncbi:MAG TPA: ribonuclease P protein component [Candidatus Paceibacterota bacterium]|nr:ribonuclease P protein component [Candidatus Paceibacterota bacterium]